MSQAPDPRQALSKLILVPGLSMPAKGATMTPGPSPEAWAGPHLPTCLLHGLHSASALGDDLVYVFGHFADVCFLQLVLGCNSRQWGQRPALFLTSVNARHLAGTLRVPGESEDLRPTPKSPTGDLPVPEPHGLHPPLHAMSWDDYTSLQPAVPTPTSSLGLDVTCS